MENAEMVVENAIAALIDEFIEDPFYFDNEKLLHYKFHDLLCNKTQFNVRWEYPTNEFYARKDGNLIVEKTKYNAKFDIALVDEHDESVPFAFEFKLDIDNGAKGISKDSFKQHTLNDYEKLTNPKNQVMNGYMLYFVWSEIESRASEALLRRKIEQHRKNLDILWSHFKACNSVEHLKMALVECNVIEGKKYPLIRMLPDDWIGVN